MSQQSFNTIHYERLPHERHSLDDGNLTDSERAESPKRRTLPKRWQLTATAFVLAIICFILGRESVRIWSPQQLGSQGRNGISLRYIPKVFHKDERFAQAPPASDVAEPIWDGLLPNGLGYIQHPDLAPELSVISVFHQLHCLYTIRRAYYSQSHSEGTESFDFGLNRTQHTAHCFEYLRQALTCSADSTIEPAGDRVEGFLGWGFERQCRDYQQLSDWAEQWRAFDAHGFLASDLLRNHSVIET